MSDKRISTEWVWGDGNGFVHCDNDAYPCTGETPCPDCMPYVRSPVAADLPDGTVVARQKDIWIKSHPDDWHTTYCSHDTDSYVDFVLSNGARVLRYGYDGSTDD